MCIRDSNRSPLTTCHATPHSPIRTGAFGTDARPRTGPGRTGLPPPGAHHPKRRLATTRPHRRRRALPLFPLRRGLHAHGRRGRRSLLRLAQRRGAARSHAGKGPTGRCAFGRRTRPRRQTGSRAQTDLRAHDGTPRPTAIPCHPGRSGRRRGQTRRTAPNLLRDDRRKAPVADPARGVSRPNVRIGQRSRTSTTCSCRTITA